MQKLLTIKEVAAALSCSPSHVYVLLDAGRLPSIRIGTKNARRIHPDDLDAFLKENRSEGKPPDLKNYKIKHLKLA